MIKSMTGYGKGEHEEYGMKFSIEIKSVNHRYGDLTIRSPRTLSFLEERIRRLASVYFNRGKVDIYINYDFFDQDVKIKLNENLINSYIDCFNTIKEKFDISGDINLNLITRFPDVLKIDKIDMEEDLVWNVLESALQSAFESFSQMKIREGKRLYDDILNKISVVDRLIKEIEVISIDTVEYNKKKFYQKIKDLVDDIKLDESRLITEVAIIADKSSIDEEIVRLKSHVREFYNTINGNTSSGKKLDFIIQEINREVNTIASKTSELGIINSAINVKAEVEKIREQVQNIE